jgi:hypothetical protein
MPAASAASLCDRSGSSVVTAVLVLLVLASLGLLLSAQVAGDQLVAANQIEAARALYAAEAGLEFAIRKLADVPGWAGTGQPGHSLGLASFSVAVSDSTPAGTPLPPGRKRITAVGHSGQAARQLHLLVALGP